MRLHSFCNRSDNHSDNRSDRKAGLKTKSVITTIAAFTMATSLGFAQDPELKGKVIYGSDDRHEYFEETDAAVRTVADATVALIGDSNLSTQPNGKISIRGPNFGTAYQLCASEPYRDQNSAAFCSGFLVAPDRIATAGHCIGGSRACAETRFVFGFGLKAPHSTPLSVEASDVYACKSVIHTQAVQNGADFAVIQLDRAVTGHQPLRLRDSGTVRSGDDVMVIGHPAGLPVKIAGGARVRDAQPNGYFVANLDTYGGNSGSAVFNRATLEVEGILVRGEQDFIWHQEDSCRVSKVCDSDACRGEDVTKIAEVLPYLGHN